MRLNSGGELLINTTSDLGDYKLQINGNARVGASTGSTFNITTNQNSGSIASPLYTDLNFLGYADDIKARIRSWDASGNTTDGVLAFWTNNGGTVAERMRITSGGNVGIGTTADLARTTILSDANAQTIGLIGRSVDNISTIRWWNNAGNTIYTAIESNANYTIYNTVTNGYAAFLTNNTERMRVTSAGELLINTTSDAGDYKLQVNGNTYGNGTAYFTGNMGIGVAPATDVLLYSTKVLSGSVAPTGIFLGGLVSATSTIAAAYYTTNATTENATFTLPHLYHYRAAQGTFGASSTVTNQYGFFVANSLTSATNNFAFYGDLAAATGRWNLYMNGTANNYLAGTLAIGTTSPNASALLDVSSTTKGFLPPRMTGAQAEAIATPAAGLMIYANNGNGTTITSTGWWGYDGTTWVKLN